MRLWTIIFSFLVLISCTKKENTQTIEGTPDIRNGAVQIEEENVMVDEANPPSDRSPMEQLLWVNSPGGLRMRSEPDTDADNTLVVIPQEKPVFLLEMAEEEVEIGGIRGHWCRVSWAPYQEDYQGWVFGAFLSTDGPETIHLEGQAWVNRPGGAYFYSIPQISAKYSAGYIPYEGEVRLISRLQDETEMRGSTGAWHRIQWNDGSQDLEGWIFEGNLSFMDPVESVLAMDSLFTLNGFYYDDYSDMFVAIHDDEARILHNMCQGYIILEASVRYESHSLVVEVQDGSYTFNAYNDEENGLYLSLKEKTAFDCMLTQGYSFYLTNYKKFLDGEEGPSYTMLRTTEDLTDGWGRWFDAETIVIPRVEIDMDSESF